MNRLCMGCMKEYDDRFEVCPHCGYAFGTPPKQSYHIPPGSVLQQRYIVGVALGFGGFGITYIGWDYVMSRKVAIKEYLPSEFATRMPTQLQVTVYSGEREEQYKEGLVKTMEEAKRLAKFESVPGIVQIYDCFEENGTSYIVMEFLEGMSLKQYLTEKGKMTPEQALPVVLQIASAMEAVHKTGILHRDIAPDNIYVLNPDEPDALQVKLLDFGAARYATTKHSKSLSVIIKPGYAPEEQYRSRGDQGSWTDVYALAATFYKMLTGVTPEDAMERSVKDEVKRPSKMGIKLAKPTETALMNALNVKIQDRTQTMEEFSQELMAAEVKEREITKDKEAVKSIPKWFLALAGVGILGVAAAIVLMMTGVIKFRINTSSSHLEKNMVRVPNVINQDADTAETVLAEEELGMSRDKMVYSNEIPLNMISYQEIKENTPVEKNTTVVVWISKGEEKGMIPSVRGVQREEAEALLKEAGFTNIIIEESMEPGVYNSVLNISEEQGSNIALSQEITITVCMNTENQDGDASEQVVMADLSGMMMADLEAALEEAGLKLNLVEEFSDQPEGMVLSQEPAPDTEVNKGSYVTVHVSKGPERVYMKNVGLMTLDEARAEMEGLGLKIGNVTEQYSDSVPSGKIISQSIAQDVEVKKGDSVDIVISKGKDPAKQQTKAQETKQTKSAEEEAAAAERRAAEAAAAAEAEAKRQAEAAAAAEAQRQAEAAAEAQRQAEAAAAAAAAQQQQEDPNRNSAFDMLN
ncbi:MAG: PASTA domain-containing protein [Brotaphodocola sp.]